jgi:uncharacterized protein YbjQ (UPF0145 family)
VFGTIGREPADACRGVITLFTDRCAKTRPDVFERRIVRAIAIRANDVIGVRYRANEMMQGVVEVLAYGTAVVAEPV